MRQIRRAAYSMALQPRGVSDECAALPCTLQRNRLMPLCATTTCMPVGSPTTQPSGRMPRSCRSASMYGAPAQPTSSSYENARWIGFLRGMARNSGTSASEPAMKPFMSQLPRPYRRPSFSTSLNGSVLQSWPSTGTTSVWPDRTMPPCWLPSWAGRVAKRLALVRSGLCASHASTPWPLSQSRTVSMRARLELRLVVSKPTSVSSQVRAFM